MLLMALMSMDFLSVRYWGQIVLAQLCAENPELRTEAQRKCHWQKIEPHGSNSAQTCGRGSIWSCEAAAKQLFHWRKAGFGAFWSLKRSHVQGRQGLCKHFEALKAQRNGRESITAASLSAMSLEDEGDNAIGHKVKDMYYEIINNRGA